jgi:hypothetical protein
MPAAMPAPFFAFCFSRLAVAFAAVAFAFPVFKVSSF